ncbi:Putative MetA-pathway of phenol degradation [Hymenobacter gelipurpurascens]|uniref:Putative MetA-pathway of phenol degradation n=1 Tax=Hymenobacter gelipurpurascens TaxID=89968 RepID=A0A212UCJ5_9BACT|nr:transporter [Hymenobacter gelipurpurascens]SNC75801.1 Putative MetA-pathway of phenol degradation [Hymenobacter gelipurpurascens]
MFTRTTLLLLGALLPLQLAAQDLKKSCPYDSAHFDLFHPVPRKQLREMRPDRPGVTESPFTVDAGHFQLETDALRLINSREDTMRNRDFHVAYAVAKMGLSRRTDLQVEVPLYSISKQRGERQTDWDHNRGFGDLAIRVKHNFLGNDQKGPISMGVVAYTRLPTGGKAGSGAVEGGLILPVNIMLPHKWNLDVQIESDVNYDREQDNHYMRVMPSVALDHEFSDVFSFLVEGVTQWDAEHSGWRSSVNIAPIFSVNDNLQFDFGTHLALSRESDREFFVGVTFRR